MISTDPTWLEIQQAAERAHQGAAHGQAIELYTLALDAHDVPWEARVGMIMGRATSHKMLGAREAVDAELTALAEQAAQLGDDASVVRAKVELVFILRMVGDLKRGLLLAQEALQIAERAGQPGLKADALTAIGLIQTELGEFEAAQACVQTAYTLIEPEDWPLKLKAFFVKSLLLSLMGQYQLSIPECEQGLQLARRVGDRNWEGIFLNSQAIQTSDLTLKIALYEQALSVFKAVGNLGYQLTILINSCGNWIDLGLYGRAIEAGKRALELSRGMGQEALSLYALQFLAMASLYTGDFQAGIAFINEGLPLSRKTGLITLEYILQVIRGLIHMQQGQAASALEAYQTAAALHFQTNPVYSAQLRAFQAAAYNLAGNPAEAQRDAGQVIQFLDDSKKLTDRDVPIDELCWWCYRAIAHPGSAAGDGEALTDLAWYVLALGLQAIFVPIENTSDAGLRRGYLQRVDYRRLLVREWLRLAAGHGVHPEEMAAFTARVQKPGRLDEVFRRLLAVGVQLNAQRDPDRLPDAIVQEIAELTGAERIALVLMDINGARQRTLCHLPRPLNPVVSGKVEKPPDTQAFLDEIDPYLDEATTSRQGFLRLVNAEGALLEQRSLLVAPLVSYDQLIGLIYCDLSGCFGRFEPEDLDLLSVLANQSAVALENANWAMTLEWKVDERTAELHASNRSLEQRTTELQIINRVQEGLVRQLDFHKIIDLVGEEITRVVPPPQEKAALYSVFIALYDAQANIVQFPYWADGLGNRLSVSPIPMGEGLTSRVIKSRQPLVLKSWADVQSYGGIVVDDGNMDEFSQSWLGVPILIGERVTGVICVQDPRVDVFTESDVRLFSTLAASLGTALENARLFDETQRLYKAGQERVAELQIINSIQQGLAAELEFQAIVDLVGDKLRQVFNTPDLQITWYDQKTGLGHSLYFCEHGERLHIPPQPISQSGIRARLFKTRQPVIWGTLEEGDAISPVIPGTDASRSGIAVPIISADRVIGAMQLENFERDHAYGEGEARLLTTIAASLGAALENARLFDETQTYLRVTEQRNKELAILNSLSEAISKTLDVKSITHAVGDKMLEIFGCDTVSIMLLDPLTKLIHIQYEYDRVEGGMIDYIEPFPLGVGLASKIITTRQPLLLSTLEEEIAHGAYFPPEVVEQGASAGYTQSWLGVPIIAGDRVLGVVDLGHYQAYAFNEDALRLLQTLSSNMGVAIENARLYQAEQQRVEELAIINSVQAALAAELNIQGIYDTVGDRIRQIFHNTDLNIRIYDPKTNLEHFPYIYENNERITLQAEPLAETGFSAHVIRTRETLVINENMAQAHEKYGSYIIPGTRAEKSAIYVPMLVGDQVRGLICLVDIEREHAFSDADVRLLQTLANSMSVALENARLFDEKQRLLKASEQHAAELAIINNIGQGLVKQQDIQSIIDLVGDKIFELFSSDSVDIRLYDRQVNMVSYPYLIETGVRLHLEPRPFNPVGFLAWIIQTGQPLLINEKMQERMLELGSTWLPSTVAHAGSFVGVPILVGDQVIGMVALESLKEGAFSDATVNLLTILSSNLGVALENARLYQETQRRADQMALTADIGREMSATLDLQTVLEGIAAHVHRLFHARDTILRLAEPDGKSFPVLVALGKYTDQYRSDVVTMGIGITGSIALNGQAEIIDDLALDPRGVHIAGTPEVEEIPETMMCAPLITREHTIGLLSVYRDRPDGLFTPVDLDFLVGLARQAAVSIENARLFAEVQRQKEYSETLVQNSPVAIITTDNDYTVTSWNQAAERLYGYSTAEALGKNLDKLVAYRPETHAEAVVLDKRTRAGGIVNCITRRCRKDGSLVDVQLSGVPVIVDGEQTGVIAIYHDLSELKQAEQAIVESQRRLMDIIDFLPDATLVIDTEGRVIAWNRAIEEMTGITANEMLGKGDYEYAIPFYGVRRPILVDLVFKPQEEIEQTYAQVYRQGSVLMGETYVPGLRGGARYLLGTASTLRDSRRNTVGAIEIIRDITERKLAEDELQQAKEAAEAATQAKSAFLAMMSHEIRTPMNAIIGMSGLLLDTELNAEQRDFAETVRNSGDALLAIINDILDFSKIEAGKMDLEQQPFDLRECVDSALDLMKLKAAEKGLELACEIASDAPAAISGDVTRLRQILVNLLSNALKFTDQGEVVVSVLVEPDSPIVLSSDSQTISTPRQPGDATICLHFSVRDTGIGIPADRLSRLFQAFSQVDASTTRKYGGTGLGLAVSKRLCEMMGGRMWVESEGVPGLGSIFHFTIQATVTPAVKTRPVISGEQPELRNRRILIVDDNATNRRILTLQIQGWGMLARATSSPGEALGWVSQGDPFDLAIVDLHMDEMDGVELARRLRAVRTAQSLPIVLLSSLGGNAGEFQTDLFAAYLVKPIRPSALFDTLLGILASQVRQAVQPAAARTGLDPEMAGRHPLRILLAEDNAVNQKLALRLLSQMGYRADVAANGLEVLQAVARQPYDVILMDVQMPEMDGLEATRQLCAQIAAPQRPRIIAMTANAMQGDREMCLEAGMDDYLSKPIHVEELVNALNRAHTRTTPQDV